MNCAAPGVLDVRDRLWTREGIDRAIRIANGELKEVQPFVVCVEKAGEGGKHVFWFGYENTARAQLRFPIGPENKFTPPPFDRGQSTVFSPSYVVLGTRVVTDQPAITWHLHKYNVQASVEKTPPCPADLQERYIYTSRHGTSDAVTRPWAPSTWLVPP